MRLWNRMRTEASLARDKGYWTNVLLLMYPFFVLATLAYGESLNFGLLLRLLVAAVFNFLFFATLVFGILSLPSGTARSVVLRTVYLCQFFYVFLSGYHFSLYQQLIGLPSIFPVIDSNSDEALEFVTSYFRWDYMAAALFLSLPMLWFFIFPPGWRPGSSRFHPMSFWVSTIVFSGISVIAVLSEKPYLSDYNVFAHMGTSLSAATQEKIKIRQLLAQMPEVKDIEILAPAGKQTHVLIINESITRNHMSLYGYPRNTTPGLVSMADQLYLLTDACSSHDNTLAALKHMLTFATETDPELLSRPNLVQIMRAAGFKTYWLSNQQSVSLGDSYISVIAKSADRRIFVNRRLLSEGVSLDEKLVEPLEEVLSEADERKFIVIHLIGAHAGYDLRYPRSYQIFDNEEVKPKLAGKELSSIFAIKKYNEYDNAILYNDYVSHQLMARLNIDSPVSVFYLSDHGEAIDEHDGFFGHGMNLPYRSMYEIPAFFWLSEQARTLYSRKLGNLENNLDKPFQGDQTIHTLLDLYGIRHPLFKSNHSLFDKNFHPKARRCDQPRYRPLTKPDRGVLMVKESHDSAGSFIKPIGVASLP